MFGIGGGEFIFIIFIILMFFGSDKIPEMARALGKGMAQLRNATNDIKSEIHRNVNDVGIDPNALTGGISEEISKAKEGFSKMVNDSAQTTGIGSEIQQVRQNFASAAQGIESEPLPSVEVSSPTEPPQLPEEIDGPIKRQR